jgi:hypothetical protein
MDRMEKRMEKKKRRSDGLNLETALFFGLGRGGRIRTDDNEHPKLVHYQAVRLPEGDVYIAPALSGGNPYRRSASIAAPKPAGVALNFT